MYAFLGALTLACQYAAKPFLDVNGLTDIVNVTAGFVACVVALVILEVRKVELANYLPSLAVAPFARMAVPLIAGRIRLKEFHLCRPALWSKITLCLAGLTNSQSAHLRITKNGSVFSPVFPSSW
ncbi:MAG: hypothetical protein WDN00_07605 [Limisphaerales bacterium]